METNNTTSTSSSNVGPDIGESLSSHPQQGVVGRQIEVIHGGPIGSNIDDQIMDLNNPIAETPGTNEMQVVGDLLLEVLEDSWELLVSGLRINSSLEEPEPSTPARELLENHGQPPTPTRDALL